MASAQDNTVPLTGDTLIDGLLQGSSWNFGIGAQTLSYSLSLNDNPNGGAWTAGLQSAIATAFQVWSNVANINFAQYGSGGIYTTSPADIAVILTGSELQSAFPGAIALGIIPSPNFANTLLAAIGESRGSYPNPEGDIALDNYHFAYSYLSPGGIGLLTMIHEIGHALGLKHTADDGGAGRPTFGSLGIGNLDNNRYTVMSYTDAQGSAFGTNLSSGNAATPMLLDILAIQRIYGANTGFHTGSDTYGFQSDGALRTIWDAGGTDTLDASSATYAVTIDLRPGHFSSMGASELAIAYDVQIENAIGGTGNDSIVGNDDGNHLDGGAGSDAMSGGPGDDIYIVDHAGDQVEEAQNGGIDTIRSSVGFSLPANVENAILLPGTSGAIQGNELDNVLNGNESYGTLQGGAGNDRLIDGNEGHGSLLGGPGNDIYVVGSSLVQAPRFTLSGIAGSPIVGNSAFVLTAANGTFNPQLFDWNSDGKSDTLEIVCQSKDATHFFTAWFSTAQLGRNLTPGYYDNAQRAAFATSGHPGLDVSGDGYGFNQVFGSFTLHQVEIDYSGATPVLTTFLVSFEQHGESPTATPIFGSIAYGSINHSVSSTVVELDDEGHDAVVSAGSYALPRAVEDLVLSGSAPSTGIGNSVANSMLGTAFADSLSGAEGSDTLFGGDGNDILAGDSGRDLIQGGSGNDTSSYASSGFRVIANTSSGIAVDWHLGDGSWVEAAVSEVLDGIENLEGGAGNDALYGDGGVNVLSGNAGNDQLYGLAGDDVLTGGAGNDFLHGGPGRDILAGGPGKDALSGSIGEDSFRFDTLPDAATNVDVVTDFAHGVDRIVLDNDIFAAFTAIGAIPAGTFVSGVGQTAAADANDFLIYDSSTGALYYDPDGNGASTATQFASLTGHPALAASDFVVS